VEEEVLLLLLLELHVELGVALFFLRYYHLAHHILEYFWEGDCLLGFICDLAEHVLQPHHVQRYLLERQLQCLQQYHYEVLDFTSLLWQPAHLLLYTLELLVVNQTADLNGGVLLQGLGDGLALEVLFAVVEGDLDGLVVIDEALEAEPVVLVLLVLLLP